MVITTAAMAMPGDSARPLALRSCASLGASFGASSRRHDSGSFHLVSARAASPNGAGPAASSKSDESKSGTFVRVAVCEDGCCSSLGASLPSATVSDALSCSGKACSSTAGRPITFFSRRPRDRKMPCRGAALPSAAFGPAPVAGSSEAPALPSLAAAFARFLLPPFPLWRIDLMLSSSFLVLVVDCSDSSLAPPSSAAAAAASALSPFSDDVASGGGVSAAAKLPAASSGVRASGCR
mmetsp:Transcript_232/g.996  ORF Transcript_232/g.996 Transcript_232/m.996 type:complete len:238 (+) Transcript_232:2578-3291(+)